MFTFFSPPFLVGMIEISSLSFTGVFMGPLVPAPLAAAWNFIFKTNFRIWILSPPALLCRPSSRRHCAQCRRGSQRACTGRRLQCRRCTCTRGAPASMSSHGLLPRGSAASTDTPDSQRLGQIRDKNFNKNVSRPFHRLDISHCPVPCWRRPACSP